MAKDLKSTVLKMMEQDVIKESRNKKDDSSDKKKDKNKTKKRSKTKEPIVQPLMQEENTDSIKLQSIVDIK